MTTHRALRAFCALFCTPVSRIGLTLHKVMQLVCEAHLRSHATHRCHKWTNAACRSICDLYVDGCSQIDLLYGPLVSQIDPLCASVDL